MLRRWIVERDDGGMHELWRGAARIDIHVVNIECIGCETFVGR